MFAKLKLRPTLFGDQITSVLAVIREGCPEHGKTLSGVPDCKPCRIIEFWEPELSQRTMTVSTPAGYITVPRP